MGGSLSRMKSLICMKKHESYEHLGKTGAVNTRKWKLWRKSSMSESLRCDENKAAPNHFPAVVNVMVCAPLKDLQALMKQWAAIRIQTYFRGFLARRALRALKAVVRIQAIFRGDQVRKQAAQALQCMESLIRAQIRVRTQRSKLTAEDSSKVHLDEKYKEYLRNCLAPTSELGHGRNSESTSICTPSSVSSSTLLASEETDVSSNHQPSYMSLTESSKAKQSI